MTGTVLAVLLIAAVLAAFCAVLVRQARSGRQPTGRPEPPLVFEIIAPTPSAGTAAPGAPRAGRRPVRSALFDEVRSTVNLDSRCFLTGAVLRGCGCDRHKALR